MKRVADIGFIVGGALMMVSALLYWVRRGAGSTLRGHDLIDSLRGEAGKWLILEVEIHDR